MSSWSDRPDAAERVVTALHDGDRLTALAILAEKGGQDYAVAVLEHLALDVAQMKGRR